MIYILLYEVNTNENSLKLIVNDKYTFVIFDIIIYIFIYYYNCIMFNNVITNNKGKQLKWYYFS
jgi:hypothetical protein